MNNTDKTRGFTCLNLRRFLQDDDPELIGEDRLVQILSDFTCPKNIDVETFLKKSAVEFTKKNQSVTYLVMSNENAQLLGYFTLAIKPLTISADRLSKTVKRKLLRIGEMDQSNGVVIVPAFLLAQLGKNFTKCAYEQISGQGLLEIAVKKIKEIQYTIGGVAMFLEAEDKAILDDFYRVKNGFRKFGARTTKSYTNEPRTLVQLLRVI